MLATTPASIPNWWDPSSRRSGPVACGFSDTDLNVSITDASRNTRAPIGGPPQATALTATTSASISWMSMSRYGAAAEWSTMTSPPTSCTNLVTSRSSVTAPNVDEAEATATRRVGPVTRPSHWKVGSSPVSMSTSAHFVLAPYRSAARNHGAMFASSSSRVTTTSYPSPTRAEAASASDVSSIARSAPNTTPEGSPLTRSAIARRAASSTAALRWADGCGPDGVGIEPRKAVETARLTASGRSMPFWASMCTQPSPSDGCNPRTRATSYAIPPHLRASRIRRTSPNAGRFARIPDLPFSARTNRNEPSGQQY